MSEPTSGRVSSLYDWTHGEDCDWQFCRNKATGRCCVCWGEPYCTPPASGRVSSRETVPVEAFDDTHPDHAEWVECNGRKFCADDCALHPLDGADADMVAFQATNLPSTLTAPASTSVGGPPQDTTR